MSPSTPDVSVSISMALPRFDRTSEYPPMWRKNISIRHSFQQVKRFSVGFVYMRHLRAERTNIKTGVPLVFAPHRVEVRCAAPARRFEDSKAAHRRAIVFLHRRFLNHPHHRASPQRRGVLRVELLPESHLVLVSPRAPGDVPLRGSEVGSAAPAFQWGGGGGARQ